jgi:hypothetical protein
MLVTILLGWVGTMMTKPDQREHIETPEDEPVTPPDAQVREHLDIILASNEFSSSRRASELLQHFVERALTGDTARLKERLLGVDICYDSIHNAHPLPGEQAEYSRSRSNDVLDDYGLIWMARSPSGTRILVLAGLTSAGTAGVGEFFSDPQRMWPVYQQLRAAAGSQGFPDSWQVLVRIQARQDVPVSVTPIAVRITRPQQG